MNYYEIKKYDISNGKGIRTSLFVCGCNFHCKNCFNSALWDFKSGQEFTEITKNYLFKLISDPQCKGLSILGGDPLLQGEEMLCLVKEVKQNFPDKDIWIWSGLYMRELNDLQRKIISYCDYFVDGRYEESQNKGHNLFKGSANQTIWHNSLGSWGISKFNEG